MNHSLTSLFALFAAAPAAMGSPLLSVGEHADLHATVDGSVAYTDNLTLDEFDELDDFRFIVQPGLSFEVGRGMTNLNAALRASYGIVRYADNSVFDTELWNVVANANYSGPRYTIGVNGGYIERQQNENDINANRELVTQKTAFAGGDIRYKISGKFSLGAGGEAEFIEYEGGTNLDRDKFTVPVNLFYELTPKLDATAGVRYRQTDVDGGTDTDDYFYNVGLTGELTEKFSTTFKVGYQDRDFTGGRDSEGTLTLVSASTFDVSTRTNIRFYLDRDFATSGDGNSVERTSARATVFYVFTPRLSGNLTGAYTFSDYQTAPREDDTYRVRVGADYRINELWSVDAFYTFRDNDSNQRGSSYTENLVQLGANFRY
ncbi:MAG: outer membrane beta-barrel protein [Puniceicoccaceae bacterium]